ncbi:cGMP-dependent protein kinase 2 [Collichthys lucidus]|uniref:cGMP-dependent protein kinase n=1 Tax=Collichthys lucidus TaxID=240159 RepID=A0A4U5VC84_COLLU|nr:cGMP-dependent protein kinase 2 [Collichthys lucidus]
MVASQCLAMGNGSIKAPRAGENSCLASIHTDPPGLETDVLRLRILHLEAELASRDQEFQAQKLQLQHLQRELEAKISQIDKLQDAIGYNSLGRSPPALYHYSHHRFSVINQGPSRFHRVAVEVHRRLKAKEGVSAEPTSENFCGGFIAAKSSIAKPIRKDSLTKTLINNAIMNSDFLKKLEPQHMREMVDCMYEKVYTKGQLVIQEGEPGNYLYVLAEGLLEVIQNGKLLGEMCPGTVFGELAILYNCKRTATVKAVSQSHIWALDRQTFQTIMMRTTQARYEEYFSFLCSNFNQMVGTYEELQTYLKKYVEKLSRSDERRNALPHSPHIDSAEAQELRRLKEKIAFLPAQQPFQELKVIATLGMGGFGRVELVKLIDEDVTFALKCIKKKHIVDTRQQEHIYSEKNILQQTNSAFIIRSYFDDATARFCAGCVLEAFDYLHTMGIVYRDLKPENLLLDAEGYVKMADFGFAKKIGPGKKTWTFCGTPEYVAPEVIMNKGHDFGADCWSLGILVFELLTGNPPFAGSDPIKIYTMVLHGIEKVDFPKKICKRPDDLIRRLCKLNPVERLGNKKNGIIDIKKHKWFQGFNWEGLRHHKLLSPLKRELKGPMDHSHFDTFSPDTEEPPDELSGWDKDF